MIWFIGPAVAIAGLYLFLREAVPALAALGSGRIRTRGHTVQIVERTVDPARFNRLVAQRLKLGGAGLLSVLATGGFIVLREAFQSA